MKKEKFNSKTKKNYKAKPLSKETIGLEYGTDKRENLSTLNSSSINNTIWSLNLNANITVPKFKLIELIDLIKLISMIYYFYVKFYAV
jgi:hypothetical protein